ncbi:CoA transferase [Nocardioides sp. NPDC051685]|uniref:CoA transferase n=1 Tax=Nocardioides sp. NPDC051685 TaxID=3364334 RepID=UPI00378773CB
MADPHRPLADLLVVDIGQYLAGPLAARLLADLGARVVRIEHPEGPRYDGQANHHLLASRSETLRLDLTDPAGLATAHDLVAASDVLIENSRPGALDRFRLGPEQTAAAWPSLVHCSLPGFGRDDPRASMPGWEGPVLAAAGAYPQRSAEMLEGEWWPQAEPPFSPLPLASVFAAVIGATGAVAALLDRQRSGRGQHVEAALHDGFFEAIGSRATRYERNPPHWFFMGSGIYECSDGRRLSLITVWHRHLRWFLQAAGWSGEQIAAEASYDVLRDDPSARARLRDSLVTMLRSRPAAEWEALAQSAGVPVSIVRRPGEWPIAPVLGAAVRVHARKLVNGHSASSPDSRCKGAGPLAGYRVLDLTRVLAGPTASRVLAELGAEVVKADVLPERTQAGHREPFFHEVVNRGKHIAEVDLDAPGGRDRMDALLLWTDVVVSTFTRPALRRLRLDPEDLAGRYPTLLSAHISTYGEGGPWSDLRGYAEIANASSGLTVACVGEMIPSGSAPNVDIPRMPFTDHLAGWLGAFGVIAALVGASRGRPSGRVHTSLVDAACLAQLPFLADGWKSWRDREFSDMPGWSASHRMYKCTDAWVFVGMGTSTWQRLIDSLPTDMGSWAASQPAATVIDRVVSCGGAASIPGQLDRILDVDGVADQRGLRVAHSSDTHGLVLQLGTPLLLSRTPVRAGEPPDHGDDWFQDELGITARQSRAKAPLPTEEGP